jgi:hypothetical protein
MVQSAGRNRAFRRDRERRPLACFLSSERTVGPSYGVLFLAISRVIVLRCRPIRRYRRVGECRDLLAKRCQRIPLGGGDLVISHCDTFLPKISSVFQIAPLRGSSCCDYFVNPRPYTSHFPLS